MHMWKKESHYIKYLHQTVRLMILSLIIKLPEHDLKYWTTFLRTEYRSMYIRDLRERCCVLCNLEVFQTRVGCLSVSITEMSVEESRTTMTLRRKTWFIYWHIINHLIRNCKWRSYEWYNELWSHDLNVFVVLTCSFLQLSFVLMIFKKYLSILMIQLRNCDEDHFLCSLLFVLTRCLYIKCHTVLTKLSWRWYSKFWTPLHFPILTVTLQSAFFLLSTDTYHFPLWSVFDIVCHDTCRSRIFASRVTGEHDRCFVGISGQTIWQRNTSSDVNYIKLLSDYVLVGDR